MSVAEKKTCLILEYTKLPEPVRKDVSGWCGFNNDCLIPVRSVFDVSALRKGMSEVEAYWKDQVETNGFKRDLKAFIKEYGLVFEVWFIEQNFDLKGVSEILVNVSW